MVTAPSEVLIVDGVLENVKAYREWCLDQTFGSLELGSQTFHGIAKPPDHRLVTWIRDRYSWMKPWLTFLRLSPLGQVEPNLRHTDEMMGQWTGIFYLNPDPPVDDGTILWEPEYFVPAVFNRLAVFPSSRPHQRALPENYGSTPESARLIQVVFGGDPIWQ